MPVYWVINYTDWHDVDEESMTITSCGGWWGSDNTTGVAARDQYSNPTDSGDSVASKKIIYTTIVFVVYI